MKKFDNQKIIELYEQGLSASQIGKIFKTSHTSILKRLKDNNILVRQNHSYIAGKRKYSLNEDFFTDIDNQKKAYILGLIYADGNISKDYGGRKRLCITLHKKDSYLLEQIKEILEYDGKLHKQENKSRLIICSRKLSNILIDKGVFPAKSLILKFPTIDQVPEHLHRHFIRGYFDGDGCAVKIKNRAGLIFNILGTKEFLFDLKQIFIKKLNCSNKVNILLANSIHSISWSKNKDIHSIFDYLYKDSEIHLKRKYEKFIEYFNEKNHDSEN